MAPELGYVLTVWPALSQRMLSPRLPARLNLTGMVLPALATLSTEAPVAVRLSIGAKKPVQP